LGLYLKFGLCKISVYPGFGLDRFHCTIKKTIHVMTVTDVMIVFYIWWHCLVLVKKRDMAYKGILFVDDLAVTVNCRTAMKVLSGYFNLCLSVKFDSLSCSFTSIAFLTKGNKCIIRQHKIVNNLIFTPIIIIHCYIPDYCKHNVGIL
jgi:hypothetical protein